MCRSIKTINHRFAFFTEANNIAQSNVSRRPSETETTANPTTGFKKSILAQVMHDFHEVMTGNSECSGDLIHRNKPWIADSGLHEHPDGIVGIRA